MLRNLIKKFGIWQTTLIITILAVLISFNFSGLISYIVLGEFPLVAIVISFIVPAVVSPIFTIQFLRLLYQLDRAEERLRMLSHTDGLTQAYNRRYFFELAELELSRAQRYGDTFTIILFDLDDFKLVNDSFGHAAGDLALKAVSQVCRENSRPSDIFARYGGEEFIFFLSSTSLNEALVFAQRIMSLISSLDLKFQGHPICLTASVGVKSFTGAETLDEVVLKADHAMYEAKGKGKNRLISADPMPKS